MKSLAIVGAGGSGRGVADLVQQLNAQTPTWRFAGYFDDNPTVARLGSLQDLTTSGVDAYVVSIANMQVRASFAEVEVSAAALVHPMAACATDTPMSPGLILRANSAVAPGVRFGRHVYINMGVTVGHDVRLGDYTIVHPGVNIGGSTEVGERVTVGAGATILPRLSVGSGATIGAGAVVTADVPADTVVTGVPARPRKADT